MSKSRTFKTGRIAVFAFAVIIIFTCLAMLPYNKAYADTTPITSSNVPDGVYAIRNASSGRYLGVDSYETGTYLRAYSLTAEPSTAGDRAYMFKIEAVGTSGNYVIRTMSNNYNSFAPVSSSSNAMLRAAEIPTTNSSVPTSSLFTVTKSTNGYTIKKNAGTYFVSQQSASGTAVVMASSSALSEWELIPMSSSYYSVGYYGGSAGVDHDIAVGETETVRTYFYSTNLSHNSVMMSLRSEDFALANTGTNTTNTMTVTPTDIGLIRHRALIMTKTGGTAVSYALDFVNIHFADGVYSFKNNYSGKYMATIHAVGGQTVGKQTHTSLPSGESQRTAMFKLTYMESANNTSDGGYYGIRAMSNNLTHIYIASQNYPNVYTSDQNPANNPDLRWKIIRASSGNYVLAKNTTDTDPVVATSIEFSSRGTIPENDDNCWHREALSSAGERAYWSVTKYTGNSFVGVIPLPKMNYVLYNNVLGIQSDISERITSGHAFYSTVPGQNNYNSVTGYMVCDVNGNAFDSTGVVPTITNTGVLSVPPDFAGMIGIRIKYNVPYGNTTTTYTSEPVRMYISPGDDSCLFISNMNDENPKYLTAVKTSSGYVVRYEEFTYSPNQLWRKESSGETGYTYLINVATGLYLTSPLSSTSGDVMTLKSFGTITVINCAKWKYTDSNALTGKTVKLWKSKYMDDYTSYILSASGSNAVQSTQSSYSYHANIGLGGDVVIFGADTWNVPSSQDLVAMRIATNLAVEQSGRYDSFSIHTFVNSNSVVPLASIDNAKIYIHLAHGLPTLQDTNKKRDGSLSVSDISDLSNLSNLDLVIFTGCNTAGGEPTIINLPSATMNKGASVSVGFVNSLSDDIRSDAQYYNSKFGNFYKKLFELLYEGKTISEIGSQYKNLFSDGFQSITVCTNNEKDFSIVNNVQ